VVNSAAATPSVAAPAPSEAYEARNHVKVTGRGRARAEVDAPGLCWHASVATAEVASDRQPKRDAADVFARHGNNQKIFQVRKQ
jgi:hypothetical protein